VKNNIMWNFLNLKSLRNRQYRKKTFD